MFEHYCSRSWGSGNRWVCCGEGEPPKVARLSHQVSAATASAAAALADVAGAGGAHLGAAGHAERGVDGGAGDLLEELGGGVGFLGGLGGHLSLLRPVGVLGLGGLDVPLVS